MPELEVGKEAPVAEVFGSPCVKARDTPSRSVQSKSPSCGASIVKSVASTILTGFVEPLKETRTKKMRQRKVKTTPRIEPKRGSKPVLS